MTTSDSALTTSGTVRERIRGGILRGELRPGARLTDRGLAAEHEVSRNSVREALRLLEVDGLVTITPNAGAAVRVLSASNVSDIFAARRVLEIGGVRASGLADDAQLREVAEAALAGTRRRDAREWRATGTASLAFHAALVALAGSTRLDEFFAGLAVQLRLAFAAMPDEGEFQAQWIDRDVRISDLVLSGRRREAEDALTAYLSESEAAVTDIVRAARS